MKSKKKDSGLQTPAEEDARTVNEEGIGPEADSGNDRHFDAMLEQEKQIDPGNEHHHRNDADDTVIDDDIDRSPKYDADAGEDGRGTTGAEAGEGKNDEPDLMKNKDE